VLFYGDARVMNRVLMGRSAAAQAVGVGWGGSVGLLSLKC
jgi:hypothetical protein